jgi:Sorting nexin C terminal
MAFHVIEEEAVSFYLRSFRLSFWPNNQPAPPYMVKSESEKVRIRELLELLLVQNVSGNVKGLNFRTSICKIPRCS